MRFTNRDEAARLLADHLQPYRGRHPLVLGVPRGGVPMARIIADALGGDLDVALVRKLRAADQPELAIGAVDESGTIVQGDYFKHASPEYIREEVRTQVGILRTRRERYGAGRPAVDPTGRLVIIVDDGIATGASMQAAVRLARARGASSVVAAAAVAPPASIERVAADADDVVCGYTTSRFSAVGQFFDDFHQVSDDEVRAALGGVAPDTRRAGAGSR